MKRIFSRLMKRTERQGINYQGPKKSYRDVWNEAAKSDAVDAICDKHTFEQFEETGKNTVKKIILPVMPKNPIALDLGCGMGRIEKYLAQYCNELYAVDVSDEMLKRAKKRLDGIDNVYLSRVDGTSLKEFPDKKFDFIFSLLVLQHMEKEDAYLYLEEIYRVLKKRGTALIQFPNFLSDAYFNSFIADVKCPPPRHENRVRPYTMPEVKKILESIGFNIIKVNENTLGAFAKDTEMMVLAKK